MKRSDQFDELKELYARMNRAERENLSAFLTAFDTNATRSYNKSAELVNLLNQQPNVTRIEVIRKLRLPKDKYNMNKFIARLKDKMLESMTLDININRKKQYSDWFKAQMDVRKKILYAQILIGRGLTTSAEKLLEEALSRGKKYELYNDNVDALRLLQQLKGISNGRRVFNKFEEIIEEEKALANDLRIAQSWYVRNYMNLERRTGDNEREELLEKSVQDLKSLVEKSDSANVKYFSYYMQLEHEKQTGDYEAAQKTCEHLAKLIEESPAISNRQRLTECWIEQAQIEVSLGNFKQGENILVKALDSIEEGSYQFFTTKRLYLHCKIYQKQYNEAIIQARKLIKRKDIKNLPYEIGQLNYIIAFCQFLKKNYNDSLNTLQSGIGKLEADWYTGSKFLIIMNILEMEKVQDVSPEESSVYQYIDELKGMEFTNRRDKVIARILTKLEFFEFNFKRTLSRNKNDFDQLNSPESVLNWQPNGHEFVPFEKWYHSMINTKSYDLAEDVA